MARKQGDAENTAINHIVEIGDKLYDLAQVYYGDGNLWGIIAAANNNISPESLSLNQSLVIPCKISIFQPYKYKKPKKSS